MCGGWVGVWREGVWGVGVCVCECRGRVCGGRVCVCVSVEAGCV